MSAFTPKEIEFLESQAHGHLATIGSDGKPHVVPVAYRINQLEGTIDISGPRITQTKKFRDVQGNSAAAFVVDDRRPSGQPQGIEIRGVAQSTPTGGREIHPGFAQDAIRIRPEQIATWGVEEEEHRGSRRVAP